MKKTEQSKPMRTEPRWPVVLNLFGVLLVFTQLSTRVHLLPTWFPYVIVLVILVPIAGVRLSGASPMWRTIERFATFGFCLLVGATIIVTLMYLINQMLHHGTEFSGQQLFTSSIGGWIGNVLVFSLVYWQIDRDGPEARMNDEGKPPTGSSRRPGTTKTCTRTGCQRTWIIFFSRFQPPRPSALPTPCR